MTVKIPQEIIYWSFKDRDNFVKSMKAGYISVFSGRGMVIGCAEAGKTTLVKKLKGERNLNTKSTSGIEIHPHVFKLQANESTITGKRFQTSVKISSMALIYISIYCQRTRRIYQLYNDFVWFVF